MAKKWIAGAIKHPGALRRTAVRMCGKQGARISQQCMAHMRAVAKRTGNTTLARRVALARTLTKLRR